jgi:hypothetical protein
MEAKGQLGGPHIEEDSTIGREPAETFWGGYNSMFVDPDGHPWEIAHNPHWTVAADGGVKLS